jgi:hypothetical protein
MPNDRATNGPPQAKSGGLSSIPKPVLIGGAALAAFVLYRVWKSRQAAAAAGGASSATDTGTPTDTSGSVPGLGSLVGGLQGGTSVGSGGAPGLGISTASGTTDSSLGGWIAAAENQFSALGIDPVTGQQALFNYVNGQALSQQQTGILDQIFKQNGYPSSDLLPVFGTIPNPTPTLPVTPPAVGGGQNGGTIGKIIDSQSTRPPAPQTAALSAIQQFVNDVYKNIHAGTVKNPANERLAEADVKSGLAALPVGFTAPTGYTLGANRFLTPVPAKPPAKVPAKK